MREGAAIKTTPSPIIKGIIQCLLHPAIPRQGAPQQSLLPFYRATGTQIKNLQIFSLDFLVITLGPGSTG